MSAQARGGHTWGHRTLVRIVVLGLWLGTGGCTAPGSGLVTDRRNSQQTVRLDLDPAKAYLSLEEIEPRIARPEKPENLARLPDRATGPITASRTLIGEQRYTEAALELERALRYAPNHPRIHEALALLHWQAGNLERAKSHAAQALETNPDSAAAHYVLGRCLATAGDKQGALAEFRTALLCGDFGDDREIAALCHFHLAEALAAEGYLTAALNQYEAFGKQAAAFQSTDKGELASLKETRRGSVAQAKSGLLERLGRFREAAAILGPVAAAAPDDIPLQMRYARLLAGAGQYDAAATVVRAITSDDKDVISLLVEIHERSGHPERVVDDLRGRRRARPETTDLVLSLADVLIRLDRTDEAQSELSEFLNSHPDANTVRRRLIDSLVRQANWDEGLRLCEEGMQRDSRLESACENMIATIARDGDAVASVISAAKNELSRSVYLYICGRIALAAGRMDDARALFENALKVDAKCAPARISLAELLLRSCDYDAAFVIAKRSDSDTPEDARLERVLGRLFDRLDDTEQAELHYRAATQLDRTDSESMFDLANVYRRTRRNLQAQRQLRVLLEAEPENEEARELLALALIEDGKGDAALREYQELQKITRNPTTAARCRAILDDDLRKDPVARRRLLMDAIEAGGADAATFIAVAETFEDSDPRKGLEFFEKAAAVDPDDEEAALGVVRANQHLLNLEGAAEGLQRLLQCRPNHHAWRRALFGYLGLLEQYDRALGLAREQESRPDLDAATRKDYRESIVEMLRESGRGDDAIQQLRTWSAAEADDSEWPRRVADEFMRQQRFAEAAPLLDVLYRKNPQDAAIRDRLLDSLREAGRYARAEQFVLDWSNEDPENDRLLMVLAHTIADAGRIDDALELIYAWLPHTSHREAFQDLLVGELAGAGRFENCVRFLDALSDEILSVIRSGRDAADRIPADQLTDERLSRRPDEPFSTERLHSRFEELQIRRIVGMTNAREFRDAEKLLGDILDSATDPRQRVRLLYMRSTLLRAQGRHDEADEAMKSVLALGPRDESLSNDLAYNWIDRGVQLGDAEPLIRFAVGRFPRQAAYLDTLGWLFYKKGNMAEAEVWLSRANRVRGGRDPVIYDHLGDTNWRLGRHAEAIENWKKAVDLIQRRREGEFNSDDERRVRDTTPVKIAAAESENQPEVAALASSHDATRADRPADRPSDHAGEREKSH